MMLKTSPFSGSVEYGITTGNRIKDLNAELAKLMRELHGEAFKYDIEQSMGYILISKQ